jgi:hypothetical protein
VKTTRSETTPDAPSVAPRPAALAGVLGDVAATCCVGPALGVATGAGAGSFLLAMGGYRFQAFLVGGAIALATGGWLLLRRRRACPTGQAYRSLRSRWLDVGLVAFALTYGLGRFVLPRIIELA